MSKYETIGDRFRGARMATYIQVDNLEGDGTFSDTARIVTYLVNPDTGETVARLDSLGKTATEPSDE